MIPINGFVKKRRNKFFDFYITAYFILEDSLLDGFDMERFLTAGRIDGMIQAKDTCRWSNVLLLRFYFDR